MQWNQITTFLDRIHRHSTDVLWIASADVTDVHYVNERVEPIVGLGREQIRAGSSLFMRAVHRADRDEHAAFRRRMRQYADGRDRAKPGPHEFRVVDGDGTVTWLSEHVFPITDRDGTVRYWGGTVRDVSDRKETKETYRVQAEELEVLNQVIRHDIRNEANLGLGLLRSAGRGDESAERKLDRLENVLGRIVDLTETARDMTDVITTLSNEPEPTPLQPTLRREVANASTFSESATVRIDGEVPDVTVESTDILSAVFRNLLKNAIQHDDGETTEVVVRSHVSDGVVVSHVADDGPGIPDDHKELVFERGETLADSDGSGFGLSLVSTLVEQYDGRIFVWDNDPKGTVFTVSLPLSDDPTATTQKPNGKP